MLKLHGLAVSGLAMSTLATWSQVVQSREVRSRDFSVPDIYYYSAITVADRHRLAAYRNKPADVFAEGTNTDNLKRL